MLRLIVQLNPRDHLRSALVFRRREGFRSAGADRVPVLRHGNADTEVSVPDRRHVGSPLHPAHHELLHQKSPREGLFPALLRRAQRLLAREIEGPVGGGAKQLRRRFNGHFFR